MMNEIEDFLKKHKIKIKQKLIGQINRYNIYCITFKRGLRRIKMPYYYSTYSSIEDKTAIILDLVSSLQLYDPGSLEDFFDESEIRDWTDVEEISYAYCEACKQYKQVKRFFTKSEICILQNLLDLNKNKENKNYDVD